MRMQESGEMYLETILILSQKMARVRAIDIVNHTGYSKPSVSRAMGLLRDGGYITVDSDGYIALTESGSALAERIYERHTLLSEFFIKIGVPVDIANEDACKIEHDISEVTFAKLKKHAEQHGAGNIDQ